MTLAKASTYKITTHKGLQTWKSPVVRLQNSYSSTVSRSIWNIEALVFMEDGEAKNNTPRGLPWVFPRALQEFKEKPFR